MVLVRIVIVVLAIITSYFLWITFSRTQYSFPTIDPNHRPKVLENYFREGLMSGTVTREPFVAVEQEISRYVHGDKSVIHIMLVGLVSGGHVLLQGYPGTGKTTAARMLSRVSSLSYARIQCTPDLLPQDVIGTEIFDTRAQSFSTRMGPIHSHIVHVDEINRATPKLQSAFLEAMQEQAITLGNESFPLPNPFFLIATQNPYDAIGTYMLPYAQVDRFMIGATLQPLSMSEEYSLVKEVGHVSTSLTLGSQSSLIDKETLLQAKQAVEGVIVDDLVMQYALSIIHTIKQYDIQLSTRATKSLIISAKAWAYLQGKDAVEKTDVDAVLVSVLYHRVAHLLGGQISLSSLYRLVTGSAQRDDTIAS